MSAFICRLTLFDNGLLALGVENTDAYQFVQHGVEGVYNHKEYLNYLHLTYGENII